jgi:cysteine desulfurase
MNLYFNNAFSKQPSSEVVQKMLPFLREEFENPLTESEAADRAREQLMIARKAVADLLKALPDEIYFVSSGTEGNNWALKGAAYANKKKNHLVISAIEHFSLYQTAQFLERQGFEISFVPVAPDGFIDSDEVRSSIRPSTILVSIQSASDEIGVIQNMDRIASLKNEFDEVLFHTDAIQFLCYEHLPLDRIPLDLVSLSSNALYGPSGVAALYVRKGCRIVPLLHGGMQEEGMRPGLQSIALIAGFGEAARLNGIDKDNWKENLAALQERCFQGMDSLKVPVTGSKSCRSVDNIHITADVDGEALLTLLVSEGIQASSGSTCYQFAQKESHVLKALGFDANRAKGSLLFTLSKDHDRESIDKFLEVFETSLNHLRKIKV